MGTLLQHAESTGATWPAGAVWPAATTAGSILVATLTYFDPANVVAPGASWIGPTRNTRSLGAMETYYILNAGSRSGTEVFTRTVGTDGAWVLHISEFSGYGVTAALDILLAEDTSGDMWAHVFATGPTQLGDSLVYYASGLYHNNTTIYTRVDGDGPWHTTEIATSTKVTGQQHRLMTSYACETDYIIPDEGGRLRNATSQAFFGHLLTFRNGAAVAPAEGDTSGTGSEVQRVLTGVGAVTATNTITLTLGSAPTPGKVLALFVYKHSADVSDMIDPSGFTRAGQVREAQADTGNVLIGTAWWKVADGSETTVVVDVGEVSRARVGVYSELNATPSLDQLSMHPVDVVSLYEEASNSNNGGLTAETAQDDEVWVGFFAGTVSTADASDAEGGFTLVDSSTSTAVAKLYYYLKFTASKGRARFIVNVPPTDGDSVGMIMTFGAAVVQTSTDSWSWIA